LNKAKDDIAIQVASAYWATRAIPSATSAGDAFPTSCRRAIRSACSLLSLVWLIATCLNSWFNFELPNQYALAKLNFKAAVADLNKAKDDIAIQVAS